MTGSRSCVLLDLRDVLRAKLSPKLSPSPPLMYRAGDPVVKCLRRGIAAFLDCHFAVNNPGKYVARTAAAGGDMFTFHIEAVDGVAGAAAVAAEVRRMGMLVGLAVKPDTGLEEVLPLLDQVRPRRGTGMRCHCVRIIAPCELARFIYASAVLDHRPDLTLGTELRWMVL